MKSSWTRLENWLDENAPHLLLLINPGATQADIEKLETIIGKKLPDDFVQFYKIHNGQNNKKVREGLIDSEWLLPIDDIIKEWRVWKKLLDDGTFEFDGEMLTSEPDKGIKNNWWNPLWIPFTSDGCGDNICIDLDPATNGHFGQVIQMRHDMFSRDLYSDSFIEYISNYISGLENGKYVYAKTWGLVDKDSPFNKP